MICLRCVFLQSTATLGAAEHSFWRALTNQQFKKPYSQMHVNCKRTIIFCWGKRGGEESLQSGVESEASLFKQGYKEIL